MIALMERDLNNKLLAAVIALVIVTLGLGLVFGETAIGALVGMISLGGAVWLFYLRRQNELGDATLRQEKERRLAYTLILARLRRYRDRVSYLDSYLKGARLFDANADDIAVVAMTCPH